jgi:ATP-dependent Clp protease protease subunit
MLHQILGGAEGPASDVEIRVKYMLRLKQRLNAIIAHHTGRPPEQVEKDCDRDYYMTATEAKDYGLVDEVVKSRKEIPALADTKSAELLDKMGSSSAAPDSSHQPPEPASAEQKQG